MDIFKGWIPTVSGRLSFGLFGERADNGPTKVAQLKTPNSRFILIQQRRDLIDWSLPKFISLNVAKLLGKYGRFRFICILKEKKDDKKNSYLTGTVIIFVEKDWDEPTDDSFNKITKTVNKLSDRNNLKLSELRSLIKERDEFIYLYKKKFLSCCSCKITRSGHAQISNLKFNPEKDIADLEPGDDNEPPEDICARESFYFLKDMAHTHQHHDNNDDSVCRVHKTINADDTKWATYTLRAMYRKVLSLKRDREPMSASSALGVLSYAKSFSESNLETDNHFIEIKKAILSISLRESIEAKKAEQESLSSKKVKLSSITIAIASVVLAILSLNISITSIKLLFLRNMDQEIEKNDQLRNILKDTSFDIIQHIIQFQTFISAFLCVVLLCFLLISYYGGYKRIPFIRGYKRTFQYFGKKVNSIIVFVVFITFLGMFLYASYETVVVK